MSRNENELANHKIDGHKYFSVLTVTLHLSIQLLRLNLIIDDLQVSAFEHDNDELM